SRFPQWLRTVTLGRSPKWTLVRIVILITAVFLLRAYVVLPIRVKGPSMLPTYEPSGLNFVNRLSYLSSSPQRFDVVAIRFAGPHVMLMKRVVGLPGATVSFHGGRLLIDGKP